MTRFIVLGLLLVVLWLALKSFTLQLKASFRQDLGRPKPPASRAERAETLVRCARCGTYAAASRVLKGAGEEVFCSEGCRRAGAA
jgi:hypothetical protein